MGNKVSKMSKFNIVISLMLFTLKSLAGIGMLDWSSKTPAGNEVANNGGQYVLLKNGQILTGLDKWYFYKNCIIGKRHNEEHITSYFIVDEKSYNIGDSKTEKDWRNTIESRGLKPLVWTRWYDTDWKTLPFYIIYVGFFLFYVSIPLAILLIWIFYRAIKYEKINFRKPFTIIATCIFGVVLFDFFLEQFPQSF